eukprot:2515965-Amphidinium_carterae.1
MCTTWMVAVKKDVFLQSLLVMYRYVASFEFCCQCKERNGHKLTPFPKDGVANERSIDARV